MHHECYETRDNVVYFVSYYVIIIALIVLYAFAIICDNRSLAGEKSWPGFPPYVQMSSLLFSYFCSRFGTTLHLLSCYCVRAAARGLPRDVYGTYCVCAG